MLEFLEKDSNYFLHKSFLMLIGHLTPIYNRMSPYKFFIFFGDMKFDYYRSSRRNPSYLQIFIGQAQNPNTVASLAKAPTEFSSLVENPLRIRISFHSSDHRNEGEKFVKCCTSAYFICIYRSKSNASKKIKT